MYGLKWQVSHCANISLHKCSEAQVSRCESVLLRKCLVAQVSCCASVSRFYATVYVESSIIVSLCLNLGRFSNKRPSSFCSLKTITVQN